MPMLHARRISAAASGTTNRLRSLRSAKIVSRAPWPSWGAASTVISTEPAGASSAASRRANGSTWARNTWVPIWPNGAAVARSTSSRNSTKCERAPRSRIAGARSSIR